MATQLRTRLALIFLAYSLSHALGGTMAARAAEPFDAYLAALQDQGYFDEAFRYLDRMQTSPLAPESFREELDYRRAMLLIERSRQTRVAGLRAQYLAEAETTLKQFLAAHAEHPAAALARSQLGNVMIEQARSVARQAPADNPRAKAWKTAFETYERAHELLVASRSQIGEQYTRLVTSQDPESKSRLSAVKSQYVQTYLAIARVLFEQADTLKSDDEARRKKLEEAAAAFAEVAQKYRAYSAGIYALLYEGECYQQLDEHQRAISYFRELMQNPDNSAPVRRLKSVAVARAVDSMLAAEQDVQKAIDLAEKWLAASRGSEERDPAWGEVKLALAKAYQQKAEASQRKSEADRARSTARELARELARRSKDLRQEAQTLLVSLGREDDDAGSPPAIEDATSFADAKEAAMGILQEMKLASTTRAILNSQLGKVRDAARRSEIQSKLAEAQQREATLQDRALTLFERAAELATGNEGEALQAVRYYLAFLYYSQERFRRAAVLAGFVAEQYPESTAARECANVALAARQRLYQMAPPAERPVHAERIGRLAEIMIANWPGQPQASAALSTLLDLMIQKGELEKAFSYLDQMPKGTGKRASADLRVGQAIWRRYLTGVQAAQEAGTTTPQAGLITLKQQAQALLTEGIAGSADGPVTETLIRAAVSLAQIYVDSGKAEEALALLEQDRYGALKLAQTDSPWLQKIPGLLVEGYRTAIRSHVALAAEPSQTQAEIAEAEKLLTELQAHLAEAPDGEQQLIGIYVALAAGFEQQLAQADPKTRPALSRGFETFLTSAAGGSQDVTILSWVADTFYGMGKGMLQGTKSSPEAQRYFTQAVKAYEQVQAQLASDPGQMSPDAQTQLRVRQAMAYRQTGNYQGAMDLFVEILSERNKILNVQMEAARTLEQWGSTGNAEAYWKAIQGMVPGKDGNQVIWGWGRIAKIVSRNPNYRNTFHQARYNIAKCRYQYGLTQSGKQQASTLRRAKADILATQKLYDLGTPSQRKRYETLLKSIQKSLGEPAKGFSE